MERVDGIKGMPIFPGNIIRRISLPGCARYTTVARHRIIFDRAAVSRSINVKILVDSDVDDLDLGLLDSQVGHLDVETVILDSPDALANVVSQARFAYVQQAFMVWDRASLMELPEEDVEVYDGASVINKGVPIPSDPATGVEFLNDFLEVPWESEHVGMLLLVELLICPHSLVEGNSA
jgi:hypothetical protein